MKKRFLKIHKAIQSFFEKLVKLILEVTTWLTGLMSLWGPVVAIWIMIIDNNFDLIKAVLYIIGGIALLYTTIALQKIIDSE